MALVKVAQISVDPPEIVELDIDPLLSSASGVFALDARNCVRRPRSRDRSFAPLLRHGSLVNKIRWNADDKHRA